MTQISSAMGSLSRRTAGPAAGGAVAKIQATTATVNRANNVIKALLGNKLLPRIDEPPMPPPPPPYAKVDERMRAYSAPSSMYQWRHGQWELLPAALPKAGERPSGPPQRLQSLSKATPVLPGSKSLANLLQRKEAEDKPSAAHADGILQYKSHGWLDHEHDTSAAGGGLRRSWTIAKRQNDGPSLCTTVGCVLLALLLIGVPIAALFVFEFHFGEVQVRCCLALRAAWPCNICCLACLCD